MFGLGTLEIVVICAVVAYLVGPKKAMAYLQQLFQKGQQIKKIQSDLKSPLSLKSFFSDKSDD